MVRRPLAILGVAVCALLICGISPAWGDSIAPGSKQAAKLGGYPELTADWWTWGTGIFPDSPILDETGELCAQGQMGKVWFLAGNFGGTTTRECTVPRGKALFFPLLNTLWWAPEDGDTAAELRVPANGQIEVPGIELTAEVDGVPIEDLFGYRAQSPPGGGEYRVEEGSFGNLAFGLAPGVRDPAVADGYWIMLEPLSEGMHTVVIGARVPDAFGPGVDLVIDVTYHLTMMND